IYGDGFITLDATTKSGNDVLYGEAGADRIAGGGGNDYIDGGAGGDLLLGELGDDQVHGGAGYDTFILARSDSHFSDGGADLLDPGDGFDTLEVHATVPINLSLDKVANDG